MYKEYIISEEDLGCDGAYFNYEELIRCKDCKNYDHDYCVWNETFCYGSYDFCSYGERKVINE